VGFFFFGQVPTNFIKSEKPALQLTMLYIHFTNDNKIVICKELQDKYSIVEICKMVGISRDTYYRYIK
jgi:hypothetical protein